MRFMLNDRPAALTLHMTAPAMPRLCNVGRHHIPVQRTRFRYMSSRLFVIVWFDMRLSRLKLMALQLIGLRVKWYVALGLHTLPCFC